MAEELNNIGYSVTDTPDEHGGVIREITAVNLGTDTVTPEALQRGVTAHDSQGRPIVGTGTNLSVLRGRISALSNVKGKLSIPEIYVQPYDLPIATTSTLGGIIVSDDLKITEDGRLSVDKTDNFSADNTKPITASAVYTQIGNINALLEII